MSTPENEAQSWNVRMCKIFWQHFNTVFAEVLLLQKQTTQNDAIKWEIIEL